MIAPLSTAQKQVQQMKAQAGGEMNLKKSMMSWVEYSSPPLLAASLINSLTDKSEPAPSLNVPRHRITGNTIIAEDNLSICEETQ